jgi:large subunit ribosomal protein L18
MPATAKIVRQRRIKRHQRLRNRIFGTPERPRLSVFRSSANMYAQIIDDTHGNTIVAASSLEDAAAAGTKAERARKVGELVADRAKAAGIGKVVFDRGGFLYHGRIKAVADGARANGLEF